ncbi:MAG: cytochrome c3 family protein [Desulfuromonadales bacterium]|nr:cytochrome c3 family protein [Desulfuromonadales bacterium]
MVSLLLPLRGEAAVQGLCSDCHTMHNSQQNTLVAFTLENTGERIARPEAFGKLLKTDCVGCHSHAGPETIVTLGDSRVPVVFNLTEPTYPPDGSTSSTLAGGNFHWLLQAGDPHGHNVQAISGPDYRFPGFAPGGVPRTEDCADCHTTLATPQSGCNGCHTPHHHADGDSLVVGREEGWYRFLGSVMQRDGSPLPPPAGVAGIEAPDWEQNPLSSRHNVYQGKPGPYVNFLETGSINQKCAGCHGLFHSQTAAESAWIRHPVDAAIPDRGEFTGFSTYDPLVPVGRQNVTPEDANFTSINRGSDLVACISCHRPHGSPYPAMLRWGYRAWPGIDPHTGQPAVNGCAVCHTAKS